MRGPTNADTPWLVDMNETSQMQHGWKTCSSDPARALLHSIHHHSVKSKLKNNTTKYKRNFVRQAEPYLPENATKDIASMTRNLISMEPDPQAQCGLFSLPAELRNYIYTLVLTVQPNERGTISLTKTPTHPTIPTVLSILQTCRLIRDEAQGIFYSVHDLELRARFESPVWRPEQFLRQCSAMVRCLSSKRRSAIRTLLITSQYVEHITGALRHTRRLEGLETLTLSLEGARNTTHAYALTDRDFFRENPILKAIARKLPSSMKEIKVRVRAESPALASQVLLDNLAKTESELMQML